MYRGSLQYLYWKKGTNECQEIPCVNFGLKNNDMKDYFTHVLKNVTASDDMDKKVDHWLDSFEKFHKKYIFMPSISLNSLFLEDFFLSQFDHPQVSLTEKMKQDVI